MKVITVEENIIRIIADNLGGNPDRITPDARFLEDLGADSLDVIDLVIDVEDTYALEIQDEDAQKMKTVADLVRHVEGVFVGAGDGS